MFYHRVDNELFRALKDNKYSTISITNYDIYTAMNADYNYDILDLEKRGNINYIGKLKDKTKKKSIKSCSHKFGFYFLCK